MPYLGRCLKAADAHTERQPEASRTDRSTHGRARGAFGDVADHQGIILNAVFGIVTPLIGGAPIASGSFGVMSRALGCAISRPRGFHSLN